VKSEISQVRHFASYGQLGKVPENTKARCWPTIAKKSSLHTRQMFGQQLF